MLTLIKLIQMLNERLCPLGDLQPSFVDINSRLKNHQIAIRSQIIWAIIALGLGGLGRIEPAQAKSLDSTGIHQSLQLLVDSHKIATRQTGIDRSPKILAQTTPASKSSIKQKKASN